MNRNYIMRNLAILLVMGLMLTSACISVNRDYKRLEAEYSSIDPAQKEQWPGKSAEINANLQDAQDAIDRHDKVAAKLHLELASNNINQLKSEKKPPTTTAVVPVDSNIPNDGLLAGPDLSLVSRPPATEELSFHVELDEASTGEKSFVPPPEGPATKVLDVFAISEEDEIRVYIIADGLIDKYDVFELPNPPRLVFDMSGLEKGYWDSYVKQEHQFIKAIRLGAHSDKVRIVLDSDTDRFLDYTVTRDMDRLKIVITGYKEADYWPPGAKPKDEPVIVEPPKDLY